MLNPSWDANQGHNIKKIENKITEHHQGRCHHLLGALGFRSIRNLFPTNNGQWRGIYSREQFKLQTWQCLLCKGYASTMCCETIKALNLHQEGILTCFQKYTSSM